MKTNLAYSTNVNRILYASLGILNNWEMISRLNNLSIHLLQVKPLRGIVTAYRSAKNEKPKKEVYLEVKYAR